MSNSATLAEDQTDASSPRRRPAPALIAFILLAGIFGALFAWITPPFWGHDEITQYGRAYQVSQGGWLPSEIPEDRVPGMRSWGGQIPDEVEAVMGAAFNDYSTDRPEPASEVDDPQLYSKLLDAPVSEGTSDVWFTNTAAYSPIPYIPQAASLALVQALDGNTRAYVYAPRIAGLIAYLAIVGLAVHALRGTRFSWVVVTVGLLPIAVFQAGTTTADTVTNALSLLLSALVIKAVFLRRPLSGLETGALLAAMVALPLSKPTYVLLPLLALLIPATMTAFSRKRDDATRKSRLWWRGTSITALVIGLSGFGLWTSISGQTTEGMGYMRPPDQWDSVRPGEQMSGIIQDPIGFIGTFVQSWAYRDLLWLEQFFGELGFSYIRTPGATQVFAFLALILAVLGAERLRSRTVPTIVTALVVLVSSGMIFGTLYLSFSPVDFYIIDGVQGRYFVPLSVLALAVVARLVTVRLYNAPANTDKGALATARELDTLGPLDQENSAAIKTESPTHVDASMDLQSQPEQSSLRPRPAGRGLPLAIAVLSALSLASATFKFWWVIW